MLIAMTAAQFATWLTAYVETCPVLIPTDRGPQRPVFRPLPAPAAHPHQQIYLFYVPNRDSVVVSVVVEPQPRAVNVDVQAVGSWGEAYARALQQALATAAAQPVAPAPKHPGGRPRKYANRADFEMRLRIAIRANRTFPSKAAIARALDIDEDTLTRTLARFQLTDEALRELAKDLD